MVGNMKGAAKKAVFITLAKGYAYVFDTFAPITTIFQHVSIDT